MISALFVREDSIYKHLNVDSWDIERNALRWPGGNACICHPPCRAWGKLRHFANPKKGEKELAIFSIEMIRKWGGVLEHPQGSNLWSYMDLPAPGQYDVYGGFTICLDQFWFGHKARKRTYLYVNGCDKWSIPAHPLRFEPVQHCVSTSKNTGRKNQTKLREISKADRERTPEDFAIFLIKIALECNKKLTKIKTCGLAPEKKTLAPTGRKLGLL